MNPRDAKAALRKMPYASVPRISGRDVAGIVCDELAGLVGREVFGSSGALGIRRDGTHATHVVAEAAALVEKPVSISHVEAVGIGVPCVAAYEGLRRAGMPGPGETVPVPDANGKVGQAVVQIASWKGARVFGVVRNVTSDTRTDHSKSSMHRRPTRRCVYGSSRMLGAPT